MQLYHTRPLSPGLKHILHSLHQYHSRTQDVINFTSIISYVAVPKQSEYFYQPVLLEVAISDIAQSRVDIRGQSNVQYIVLSTAAESLEPAL